MTRKRDMPHPDYFNVQYIREWMEANPSYPFNRSLVPRIRSYKGHRCRVCGYTQMADPDSVLAEEALCGECSINKIVGKAQALCDKHGEYLGWKSESGQVFGKCPKCMQKPKGFWSKLFG